MSAFDLPEVKSNPVKYYSLKLDMFSDMEGQENPEFDVEEENLISAIKFLQTSGYAVIVNQIEGD